MVGPFQFKHFRGKLRGSQNRPPGRFSEASDNRLESFICVPRDPRDTECQRNSKWGLTCSRLSRTVRFPEKLRLVCVSEEDPTKGRATVNRKTSLGRSRYRSQLSDTTPVTVPTDPSPGSLPHRRGYAGIPPVLPRTTTLVLNLRSSTVSRSTDRGQCFSRVTSRTPSPVPVRRRNGASCCKTKSVSGDFSVI